MAVFHERFTNGESVATFKRLPSGLWQVQIYRRGIRKSGSFPSKGAAVAWAGREEAEIMAGARGEIPNLTVQALLVRYEKEVSPGKKGYRWETIRLDLIGRDRVSQVKLRQLDAPHVSDWQQRRLQEVSGASVRRERNLLNNVFEIARKEWKWLTKNPFEGVRRPKDGKARERVSTPAEERKLIKGEDDLSRAVVIALETGMRASEIASNPEIMGRVARLVDSKNGESREVPLSDRAIEAWSEPINLTAGSISTMFAKRCRNEKVKGLTFHDLRHTACTRLAEKLDLLELCSMFGWKDPRHAKRYYNKQASEIAKKL
jgi:integrase